MTNEKDYDMREFEELESGSESLVREWFQFLFENKKYWMIPIVLVLLLLGLLMICSASPLAPFIYTLF